MALFSEMMDEACALKDEIERLRARIEKTKQLLDNGAPQMAMDALNGFYDHETAGNQQLTKLETDR